MTRIRLDELCGTTGPFGRGLSVERPASVPEGAVVTVLRVPPELAGMRVDRFVQSQLRRTSRTRAQRIVTLGAYSPDGKPLRRGARVRAEQCVLLWRAPWDEQAPEVDVPVLYEDEHLLAVDKPPLVAVHPTARYHRSTVVKILEAARGGERLKLAHRIDRETSGVLLLSRTTEADRLVKIAIEKRDRVTKEYLAITWGWPDEDRFRIERPLELDPTSGTRVKMRIARAGEGLDSRTVCTTLERRVHAATGRRYALVRCTLETGRQHQIRVHLASLGLPLVGDKLYGPNDALFGRAADGLLTDEDRALLELDRHALHAERLELDHPITGARLSIVAPLARDLEAFWGELGVPPPCATPERAPSSRGCGRGVD